MAGGKSSRTDGRARCSFAMIAKTVRRLFLPLAAVLVLAPASVPAGEPSTPAVAPSRGKEVLVIKDSKDAQTFNAEGQDVTVNGSHNHVTIKGTCHALTISGNANVISLEGVSSISVTGEGNEVSWSKAADGERPQVTDLGKSNNITHPSGGKAE